MVSAKALSAMVGVFLVMGLAGCTQSDQRKAREETREAGRELSDAAKKAGHEIDKDAKQLSEKAENGSASEKMSRVDNNLDHAALIAKVKSRLASDAGLSTLAHVEVDVDGNTVTLRGTAATAEQKIAAGQAAGRVDGVAHVRNHLAVQP